MINLTKKVIPVLLLLFFAAQVYAEDVGLDKIIVTGTRVDENLENAPQSVSIIKRKDIETGTAQNLLDVIREDTGVTVTEYSSGNSKLASVDIRGFGETGISNSLVLIDGRRTNSMDLSGTDWAQIPLEEVERIEIIRGAGSVFYGDNASGGVINIITREPKEKAKVEAKSEAGSYATYNQMLEASGRSGKFKFLAFGKYYQSAGYRNNNDITSNDFLCKVGNKATDSLNLKLTLGYHRDAYGLPGALDDDQLNSTAIGKRGSVTPLDDAKTLDYFGDFNIENDFRECGKLETGVNMRVRQVKSNYMSTDSPWESDNYITTFGMTPKYQITHAIGDRENKITLGFDYSDAQDHIRSGVPNSENNVIIISRKSYGIYCLDQFFILKDLSLTGGYRFEKARYNFEQISAVANQNSLAKNERAPVLSAGLNWVYGPRQSNAFMNFGQSFRFPLVDEMYSSGYPGYGGEGLNMDLSQQRGTNIEAGLRNYFTEESFCAITIYRMDMRNEIYFNPYNFTNTNYDKTLHSGVEFNSKFRLCSWLSIMSNYAFTEAIFKNGEFKKKKIPGIPVHKWTAGLDLNLPKHLYFYLGANYTGERYFLSDQKNEFPRLGAYATVDMKLSYKIDDYTLYTAVNNFFDENYSEYGVIYSDKKHYYPSRGRNFVIGGSVKF